MSGIGLAVLQRAWWDLFWRYPYRSDCRPFGVTTVRALLSKRFQGSASLSALDDFALYCLRIGASRPACTSYSCTSLGEVFDGRYGEGRLSIGALSAYLRSRVDSGGSEFGF